MELITGINRVMAYTEQNLKEKLDSDKLAQLSGCSYADFQRVFSLLNHMSYLEYVKARRLSQAAVEIIHSRKRILDIALEYGYESADVFAAAFRRAFGCSPSQARKQQLQLQLFLPRTFAITVHGNTEMKYEIKRKAGMHLSGHSVISSQNENRSITFWSDVKADGTLQRMMQEAATAVSYGLCFGYDRYGDNRYMIAVEGELSAEYEAFELPAAEWMIFQNTGPVSIGLPALWKTIYAEVLPVSGYDRNENMPTVELYGEGSCEATDYHMEIWIPILRR